MSPSSSGGRFLNSRPVLAVFGVGMMEKPDPGSRERPLVEEARRWLFSLMDMWEEGVPILPPSPDGWRLFGFRLEYREREDGKGGEVGLRILRAFGQQVGEDEGRYRVETDWGPGFVLLAPDSEVFGVETQWVQEGEIPPDVLGFRVGWRVLWFPHPFPQAKWVVGSALTSDIRSGMLVVGGRKILWASRSVVRYAMATARFRVGNEKRPIRILQYAVTYPVLSRSNGGILLRGGLKSGLPGQILESIWDGTHLVAAPVLLKPKFADI